MRLGINLATGSANQPQNPFMNHFRLGSPWTVKNGVHTCQVPVLRGQNVQYDLLVTPNVKKVSIAADFSDGKGSGRVPVGGLVQFACNASKPGMSLQINVTPDGDMPFQIAMVPTQFRKRLDAGETFNPVFVDTLRPFKRIRFMDWSRVNDFALTDQRALPGDASYNPNGVPVEVQAQLCNLTGADMWTNLPIQLLHRPDLIRMLIFAARAALGRGQKLSVEVGNEVWNPGFSAHAFALAAASVDVPAAFKADVWVGQQAAAVSKIIASLSVGANSISSSGAPGSIEIVLAGQGGHTNGIKRIVAAYQAAGGDMAHVRAIACAPYLTSGAQAKLNDLALKHDVDGAIAMLRAQLAQQKFYLQEWGAYARSIGKPFWAYETNIGLMTHPPMQEFCQAVQWDPRGAAIFMEHLDNFAAAGGTDPCIFNDCSAPGNAGQWALWPWPGAEPNAIGKAVLARA